MPINFTAAYQEAITSANFATVIIDTIKLDHSTFPQPLRFARCEHDIVFNGDTYVGKEFTYTLPQVSAKTNTSFGISFSNISAASVIYIDGALATLEPILLTYKTWLLSDTSNYQAGFSSDLEVINLTMRGNKLSVTASYPDLINLKLPRVLYTTKEFGGLR